MSSTIDRRLKAEQGPTGPTAEISAGTITRQIVPPSRRVRNQLRAAATAAAAKLDRNRLLDRVDVEQAAREIIAAERSDEQFIGWTMVAIVSAYWRPSMTSVPYERRLLLAPGDLACDSLKQKAAGLGYRLLAVEETEQSLTAINSGEIDAVLGLAPLDLLEKAVDLVFWLGIPCLAIPLHDDAAMEVGPERRRQNGTPAPFDADWLAELIELPYDPAVEAPTNYLSLARTARQMFEPDELEQLAPRLRGAGSLPPTDRLDPIGSTEAIAYDFLAKGGKYSRPFITLAVHDAMTGGHGARPGALRRLAELPACIKRTAISIEAFHKASLVHDDIEDDDPYRYGEPTVHKKYGAAVAINVGDYLIGLGYRLVSREAAALGAQVASDIIDRLADAHLKLSEGQGAELLWRDTKRRQLTPRDAIEIYALKTAPAFEAALLTGLRLAGPTTDYTGPIGQFARSLGVAFQIINDLGDWQPDRHNKLIAAGDVIGGRPTLLWALALEGLAPPRRAELERLAATVPATDKTIGAIRGLYLEAGAFDKAERLIQEYESSARAIAAELNPPSLRRLLAYLVDIVLKGPALPAA